jgi:hypothetical protein
MSQNFLPGRNRSDAFRFSLRLLRPSLNAPPTFLLTQEVLDKFEFFPIKCRVLRAREDWSAYRKLLANEKEGFWGERKLKMKVTRMCALWKVVAMKRGCDSVYRDTPYEWA